MKIIKYPISTEKAVRLMDSANEIVFAVDLKANKIQIKKEVEKVFKVKVEKVRTTSSKNIKKAYVRLSEKDSALDVATELGMI
jgi:ribosomal protein L23